MKIKYVLSVYLSFINVLYSFKSKLEDFFVQEQLWFELTWSWDYFYVFFEKAGINTMDVVSALCSSFRIPRKLIGIAGLKDKHGVTQQRVSISINVLNQIWWADKFLEILWEHWKILKTDWHDKLLTVGKNSWNNFKIILYKKLDMSQSQKKHLIKNLNHIKHHGILNFYGMQRFGKWLRNYKRVVKLIRDNPDDVQVKMKFNLQSYVSLWFNEYLYQRLEKYGIEKIDGDILINKHHGYGIKTAVWQNGETREFDYWKCKKEFEKKDFFQPDNFVDSTDENINWIPAAPLLWCNLLTSPNNTEAVLFERKIFTESNIIQTLPFYIRNHIYGLRRPLFAKVANLKYEFNENGDLILEFGLPTGSYATVLLGQVFQDIDLKTYEENWFLLARVPEN